MRRWLGVVVGSLWGRCGVVVGLLLVLAPLGGQTTAQEAAWRAPERVTVRWLEPGHILVRWHQRSDADYVLLGVCDSAIITEDTCTLTTTLRHRMAGVQTATTWGQPGNAIYFWEYTTIGANAYAPLGEAVGPLILPPYPTYLPVLR